MFHAMQIMKTVNQKSRLSRRYRCQAIRMGAFTVEFALVSSLFFVILLSSFEFSRIYYARHCLDQASYEAARLGIIPGATVQEVQARATTALAAAGVKPLRVDVEPHIFSDTTTTVTVTITCDVAENSWLPSRYFLEPTITGRTTLDHENQSYLLRDDRNDAVGDNKTEPIDT